MLPLLRLGPLTIQTPGLALLAGVWVALEILSRESVRLKLNVERVYNGAFYGLIAGIAAGRLFFVATHWDSYRQSLLSILSIQPGSENLFVGLAIGAAVAFLYVRPHVASWPLLLDAIAPALAAMAAAIALANAFGGDGYGTETDLPWGIELWSARRHPTQFYELIAALIVLAILWRWCARWPYPGAAFLALVVFYGSARLFLEAFRGDSWIVFGAYRGAQVIALAAVTIALIAIARRASPPTPSPDAKLPASGEGEMR